METDQIKENLELIEKYQKEIYLLSQTSALLHWDNQTYMPKNASDARAEQLSFLSTLIHEKMTSEELFDTVTRLKETNEENNILKERDKILINKLHKEVSKSRKLPKEFVAKLSKTTALSFNAWKEARDRNDFEIFKPHLKRVVDLKREESSYLGMPGHPYNGLIDSFEEGMTAEKLKPIFEELKSKLIEILKEIKNSKIYKNQKKSLSNKDFDKVSQIELAKEIAINIGLTEDRSRLDLAEHPFSTKIGKGDVRITTNVRDDVFFSITSTIHEAGHALYELNLPDDEEYTLLSVAPSYGLHESQSRFWELMIGQARPFWQYYFPKFDKKFNLNGDFENWYKELNFVSPSPIRIESDEIHYCLHIILRYEIELGLLDGTIEVEEVKEIWNKKIKEYFGIDITSDKDGVLQDVHWSEGYFGYFPSYAIGTIYSSQIYNQLKKNIPDIEGDIFEGNFERVRTFLKKNIHSHGSKKLADEIIKDLCGKGLDIDSFINYLKEKYKPIYDLSS